MSEPYKNRLKGIIPSVVYVLYWMRTQGNSLVCHGISVYQNMLMFMNIIFNLTTTTKNWYDKVRHFGISLSCDINDSTYIIHKRI